MKLGLLQLSEKQGGLCLEPRRGIGTSLTTSMPRVNYQWEITVTITRQRQDKPPWQDPQ